MAEIAHEAQVGGDMEFCLVFIINSTGSQRIKAAASCVAELCIRGQGIFDFLFKDMERWRQEAATNCTYRGNTSHPSASTHPGVDKNRDYLLGKDEFLSELSTASACICIEKWKFSYSPTTNVLFITVKGIMFVVVILISDKAAHMKGALRPEQSALEGQSATLEGHLLWASLCCDTGESKRSWPIRVNMSSRL